LTEIANPFLMTSIYLHRKSDSYKNVGNITTPFKTTAKNESLSFRFSVKKRYNGLTSTSYI